jgi:ribonuclease BN (tRNA processing enzyme)
MTVVTFLGVGAAIPAPGRTNSSFLVEAGDVCLLFDCGPAVLQQLAAAGRSPGDVTHLFVSHGHGDHALGWPMFLLWWALEGRQPGRTPPVVVASTATWAHLRALWEHSYNELPPPPFAAVELPTDAPGRYALMPAVTLRTWPMVHSTVSPVLGARIEAGGRVLAFTADTARCESVVELARGADLLVHDARYAVTVPPERTEQSRYHCSAQDAGEYAALAGVGSLALVHIGPEYEGRHADLVAEARARFAGRVFAPAAGEVFRL